MEECEAIVAVTVLQINDCGSVSGVRRGPSSCNGTLRVHLRLTLKIDMFALS